MRILSFVSCALIAAAAAMPAGEGARAQGMGLRPMVQDQRAQPGQQRRAERPMPRRDMDESEQRGGGGRMSPEERRQLRQDIQDAGKDIYRQQRQERRNSRRSDRR